MTQINARDWSFEVSSDGGTTYQPIEGITSFEHNPGENQESVDTTTFASAGQHESQAMQRGATLAITGRRVEDGSGALDPGQQAVEDAAALVGEASLVSFRFAHDSQVDWTVWSAWAALGTAGGGNNDKTSWGATFTKSGPATTEAKGA